MIEGYSRLLGWYDFAVKRPARSLGHGRTQKQDVQHVRHEAQQTAASNGSKRTSYAVSSASRAGTEVRVGTEMVDKGRPSAGA